MSMFCAREFRKYSTTAIFMIIFLQLNRHKCHYRSLQTQFCWLYLIWRIYAEERWGNFDYHATLMQHDKCFIRLYHSVFFEMELLFLICDINPLLLGYTSIHMIMKIINTRVIWHKMSVESHQYGIRKKYSHISSYFITLREPKKKIFSMILWF